MESGLVAPLAAERLTSMKRQIGTRESPSESVLKAISALALENFPKQPPHLQRLETLWAKFAGKFYVARKEEALEVVVPLAPFHRNPKQKSVGHGWKIVLKEREVTVEPIIWLTAISGPRTTGQRAPQGWVKLEIDWRHYTNHSSYFPEMLEWGMIDGSREKKLFNKVLIIDRPCERDLEQLLRRDPNYFKQVSHLLLIIEDLFQALIYINKNFVHCDLKPANALMEQKSGLWRLKLTDFGVSTNSGIHAGNRGTPVEMAPEVFCSWCGVQWDQVYRPEVDMWGAGMIIYSLLHPESLELNGWPEFKKMQYRVLRVQPEEKIEDAPALFRELFPTETWFREHERYKREQETLFRYLFKRWKEEVKLFATQVQKSHPDMLFLHKLLKTNPKERTQTPEEALKEFQAYKPSSPTVLSESTLNPFAMPKIDSHVLRYLHTEVDTTSPKDYWKGIGCTLL